MSKYAGYRRESVAKKRKWKVHPVWRGIGLLMMILIPIMAWAAADVFLTENQKARWLPLPAEMYQPMGFVGFRVEEAGGMFIGTYVPWNLGLVLFTGIFMAVGFGLFTVLYAFIYRMVAPPRYMGYDSPPVGKYRPPPDQGKSGRTHK
jgi:hypothetical protein